MTRAGRHLALSCSCLFACLALALSAARAHGAAAPDAAAARLKIEPWVFAHATATQPAEFIVVLDAQADLSPAELLPDKAAKARFVRDALLATARASQAPLLAWLDAQGVTYRPFYIVNAVLVNGTLGVAEAIAGRSEVARIEGNPELPQVQPVELSEDERRAMPMRAPRPPEAEPGVLSIRAPEVWALGATGQGLVLGSADTGVQWDHPALEGHYLGWNGSAANHDYHWHDSVHSGGGACGPDSPFPCDDHGHGTHTTGTAVGDRPFGVAPGATFIACRNMDQGTGTPARYIECMEWFLAPYPVGGTPAQGDPAKAPDLTINSWSCPSSEGCAPGTLLAAVAAQRAAGIMMVVAAGNSGPACATVTDPPSFYADVFTAGAYSASTGLVASFSSRGPATADLSNRTKPDVTAPGVNVRSATRGSDYASFSGTSMATPHVAGAVALLWSEYPVLRNRIAATEDILDRSAVPVASNQCIATGIPNNVYGWGRLDIKAAVDLGALGLPPDSGSIAASPMVLAHAFPNPAHHSTLLHFRLAQAATVNLSVFASNGRRVRTLLARTVPAGESYVHWDGRDDDGEPAGPSVYFVQLRSPLGTAHQKLIWLGH